MSTVLVTAGPIPAKVDAVKFITNRFKGGLAVKTAHMLRERGHDVTLMAWEHSDLQTDLPLIRVTDVYDYYNKVLDFQADAYVLAAAVANLGPVAPIEGKFPSHKYQVGEVFSIEFTIMPRVIDEIKKKRPASTLIGYKLLDVNDEELIRVGRHTLYQSRANLVFANHPSWAKNRKIAITADGAAFDVDFESHVSLIDRLLRQTFYHTTITSESCPKLSEEQQYVVENYPRTALDGMVFGTFAIKMAGGFITTTRGKKSGESDLSFVTKVDHGKHEVTANKKATLNAPLLHRLLEQFPNVNYIVHDHELIGTALQGDYQFPGTDGDNLNAPSELSEANSFCFQLPHHGYVAGFSDFSDCRRFLK